MIKLGSLRLEGLSKPTHVRGAAPWHEFAYDHIATITTYGRGYANSVVPARVFAGQGTRDDFGDRLTVEPRSPSEDLPHWLARLFGDGPVCAALNGLNAWSDGLDDLVRAEFLEDWLSRLGGPLGGIDVYAFMGCYPITPFGIHKDAEHTFLYHLGPGKKQAWVWLPQELDRQHLHALGGFRLEALPEGAFEYMLDPGDVLFIPAEHYHVLANPEFSVTLGIAPYESRAMDFAAEVLRSMMQQYFDNEDRPRASFHNLSVEGQNEDLIHRLISGFAVERIGEGRLRTQIRRELKRMASNLFYKYGPPERPLDITGQTGFTCGHHSILFDVNHDLQVFARGAQLDVPATYASDVAVMLRALNLSRSYTIDEFVAAGRFEAPRIVRGLLSMFLRLGVLRILSSASATDNSTALR